MILQLLGVCLLIIVAVLIGKIAAWKIVGTMMERNIDYLVSFAAGVFLVLVIFLSQEVITESTTPLFGFGWIIMGLLLVWFTTSLIPEGHYHYHADEKPFPKKIDIRKMLAAVSIHNAGDGVLLAIALAASPILGFVTAVSIFIHKLAQEISEFFILRNVGYGTQKAFAINLATSSTILIGAFVGYFLFDQFAIIEIPILGFATGALLSLLMQDLIPHSFRHAREKRCAPKHIIIALLGVGLMLAVFQSTDALFATYAPEDSSPPKEEVSFLSR
tara:strand:+ start:5958 stop:6779 length:822 start_codon:yes stop_codon:yes gene_type:complete